MAFFRVSGIHGEPSLLPDSDVDDDAFRPPATSAVASNFIDAAAVANLGGGDATFASAMSHTLTSAISDSAATSAQIVPGLLTPQTAVQWTQQPSANYPFSTAFKLVAGDFNGDGALDVLYVPKPIGFQPPDELALTLGNGDGTFQTPIMEPVGGAFASGPFSGLAIPALGLNTGGTYLTADLNNDGITDLIAKRPGPNTPSIYESNGTGFTTSTPIENAFQIVLGDFNNDGSVDIVESSLSGPNRLYLNDGHGGFTEQAKPFTTGALKGVSLPGNFNDVIAADFNGDGLVDLAMEVGGPGTPALYLNNGAGFTAAASPFSVTDGPDVIVVGDFNSDGYNDVLLQPYNSLNAVLYLNKADGTASFDTITQAYGTPFTTGPFAGLTLTSPTAFSAVGDLDGDGDSDLIMSEGLYVFDVLTQGLAGDPSGHPPQLVSSTPSDGAGAVADNADITLTFSEAVTRGTGNIQIFDITAGAFFEQIPVTDARVSGSGTTWTIDPDGTFVGHHYAVRIAPTALVGADGRTFPGISSDATLDFIGVNAPSVSAPDAFNTDTATPIGSGLNLFNNNGGGADSDPQGLPLVLTQVNGSPDDIGHQITLPSGALLTINADGTFSYDPNHAFDSLTGSATTTDSFTYSLDSGSTATVTIWIHPAGGGTHTYTGTGGDDIVYGDNNGDLFNLGQGGNDTAIGGSGDDGFAMGGAYTAADKIDGGGGTNNQVQLDGNYAGVITLSGTSLSNIQVLALAQGHSYSIATTDDLVGAGKTFTFWSAWMTSADHVGIDASQETNGNIQFFLGAGNDTADGGWKNDTLSGGGGQDTLTGGLGADTFRYFAVSNSTSVSYDIITDFTTNIDHFDLPVTVNGVNSRINGGTLSTTSFDSDLAAATGNGFLSPNDAVIFAPNSGNLAGHAFLIVDANGIAGYQAGQDYVFDVTGGIPGGASTATVHKADFI